MSGMRIIAAYLLATLGRNPKPSVDDISRILNSVGIASSKKEIEYVIEAMKTSTPEQLIRKGHSMLSSPGGDMIALAPPSEDDSQGNQVGVDFLASIFTIR